MSPAVKRHEHKPVVLIHGLWMNGVEMALLGRRLASAGFSPIRFSYSSLKSTPLENSQILARFIQDRNLEQVHFVGHSLGGIVLLHLLANCRDLPPGRIVLMGTPVQGSSIARKMASRRWLRPLLGRSVVRGLLGDVPFWQGTRELGVIVGTHNLVGVGRFLGGIDGEGDGTVAWTETLIPQATDSCTMKTGHMSMLFSSQVAEKVVRFLHTGNFMM